ncbi:MAG: purine-nucleoside phosphorylase [Oscillospiraceae bacterium]|nr:purine-nucleoside phosphorylase [Oscillospiraceae bacterium]
MSIHIGAEPGAVASGILLPGDPLRAKYIAENYFENPVQFNKVRGMYGFTGTYRGKRVSTMGSGMGMPSISIYATELMRDYGVKTAIRIGTCGSMSLDLHIKDMIAAEGASTDSDINRIFPGTYCPVADFDLLRASVRIAKEKGLSMRVGMVLSSDCFYQEELTGPRSNELWIKYGALAGEMETAALYTLAKKYGVRALSLLTVSDSIVGKEAELSADERQTSLDNMICTALDTLCEFV